MAAKRLKTRKIETLAIAFLRRLRVLAAFCFWRQTVSNSPLALCRPAIASDCGTVPHARLSLDFARQRSEAVRNIKAQGSPRHRPGRGRLSSS